MEYNTYPIGNQYITCPLCGQQYLSGSYHICPNMNTSQSWYWWYDNTTLTNISNALEKIATSLDKISNILSEIAHPTASTSLKAPKKKEK